MKTLVVEDDSASRVAIEGLLEPYGQVVAVSDGVDALGAFRNALQEKRPYDLVCLDILMPEMDGHAVLAELRKMEKYSGVEKAIPAKIIMITVLGDSQNIMKAFGDECDAYIIKPVHRAELVRNLRYLELV